MGYQYAAQSFAADDHTLATINLNHHIALRYMKSSRAILALGADITNFLLE